MKIERTWENLKNDEKTGELKMKDEGTRKKRNRGDISVGGNAFQYGLRRGVIRCFVCVVDISHAANINDMKPTRLGTIKGILIKFIETFFEENPLSSFGILTLKNGKADILSPISSTASIHLDAVESLRAGEGEASLQNGLELIRYFIHSVPSYSTKEVLILSSSLSSCDAGDIYQTIDSVINADIRVSIISLAAETYICKKIATMTHGLYSVALDAEHLSATVKKFLTPLPSLKNSSEDGDATDDVDDKCYMIKMGFPSQTKTQSQLHAMSRKLNANSSAKISLHADTEKIELEGFICPQCKSVASRIPSKCKICGLNLISAAHLARTYHHLFPVAKFIEIDSELASQIEDMICCGCGLEINMYENDAVFRCSQCDKLICDVCEAYIHETLYCHDCTN